MNVFGTFQNLVLEIYSDPERFLSPSQVESLHKVAESAFNKEGVPERSDTENHIIPCDALVAVRIEEDYVGFSSTSRLGGTVYEVGIAVEEDFQGNSLGGVMLSKSVSELAEGEEIFTYRTQNPAMYGLSDNLFDVYPQKEKETPERLMEEVQNVGAILGAEKMEGHIEKSAYSEYGGMYDELPEGERRDFLESQGLRPFKGDAVIVAAEISEEEVGRLYQQCIQEFGHAHGLQISEVVEK